jgi:hypothetical protein
MLMGKMAYWAVSTTNVIQHRYWSALLDNRGFNITLPSQMIDVRSRSFFIGVFALFLCAIGAFLYLRWSDENPTQPPTSATASGSRAADKGSVFTPGHQSIDFYGKVIDQDGQALAGATIIATYGHIENSQEKVSNAKTTSDAEGRFSFEGLAGIAIMVDVKMNGYVCGTWTKNFRYGLRDPEPGTALPTPASPKVFTMWKTRGPEPGIFRSGEIRMPGTGEGRYLELFSGKVSREPMGDLAISVKWLSSSASRFPSDVDITFRALHGGFVRGNEDYWFLAPDTGHLPQLIFSTRNDTSNYHPEEHLYFKSTDGRQYARINFNFGSGNSPGFTSVSIGYHLNPNGSRNLQCSEKTQINRSGDEGLNGEKGLLGR